jgi:hypothetical protein
VHNKGFERMWGDIDIKDKTNAIKIPGTETSLSHPSATNFRGLWFLLNVIALKRRVKSVSD